MTSAAAGVHSKRLSCCPDCYAKLYKSFNYHNILKIIFYLANEAAITHTAVLQRIYTLFNLLFSCTIEIKVVILRYTNKQSRKLWNN